MVGETKRPDKGMAPHVVWAVVSAVVLVLFAPALFVAGFFTNELVSDDDGGGTTVVAQPTTPAGGTPVATATPPPGPVDVSADDDPFIGPEDASVTIIDFSDFQWPFCKRFRDETLDQILETYEGKIKYVHRDFPLSSIHPWAQKAAEAAECANEQDKFWEYHDLLFAGQNELNATLQSSGVNGVVDSFKSYAADLGLDSATFDDCLDSGKYTAEVQKDLQDGQVAGVTGTPGFFINGVQVKGAQPFSTFQQVIDAALAEAAG